MPKSWYNIKAAAEGSDVAEVNILDYIGAWGVNAKEFLGEFRALKASTVKVYVNSPGGSVFEALAIFNGMRATGKTIEIHILGVAASAASYIAMAGDKIVMPSNTMMFVHNPINAVYGNAEEMREMADVLDKIGASLMATYMKRWKGEEQALKDLFAAESYLTAAECLENGFCDEVTEEITAEAAFDVDRLPEAVQAVFAKAKVKQTPIEPAALSADDVEQLAKEAGAPQYAGFLALDRTLTTAAAVTAAAKRAADVVALCRIAGFDAQADSLVRGKASLADVQAKLAQMDADKADAAHVDTAARAASLADRSPENIRPLALWADIHALEKELQK
jgi:ATP-dependent Clp protease, protease subunit